MTQTRTMLPEHISDILARWRNNPDYTYVMAQADIEVLCEEIEKLEVAWRAAEERVFMDTQELVRLKHLLFRLRCSEPPDAESPGNYRLAYEGMLEAVDAAIRE